ncbi:AAA family ATPase [Candidatus Woesearchaeota archaeon]|nr:AAA family ATPase [Candidatus Woesearchaeota archaeon]
MKEIRVFIIEGIAGSGKTTFHNQLKKKLKNKTIYDFSEEELLFSWKHAWLKNINSIRLNFMNSILDYIQTTIKKDSSAVFILNRFHISFAILAVKMSKNIASKYNKLIQRIKKLPVKIFVPTIKKHEIEKRSSHKERKEKIWGLHQQKRMKTRNFSNLTEMYVWEQNLILKLLKKQKIPYSAIKIKK